MRRVYRFSQDEMRRILALHIATKEGLLSHDYSWNVAIEYSREYVEVEVQRIPIKRGDVPR